MYLFLFGIYMKQIWTKFIFLISLLIQKFHLKICAIFRSKYKVITEQKKFKMGIYTFIAISGNVLSKHTVPIAKENFSRENCKFCLFDCLFEWAPEVANRYGNTQQWVVPWWGSASSPKTISIISFTTLMLVRQTKSLSPWGLLC